MWLYKIYNFKIISTKAMVSTVENILKNFNSSGKENSKKENKYLWNKVNIIKTAEFQTTQMSFNPIGDFLYISYYITVHIDFT